MINIYITTNVLLCLHSFCINKTPAICIYFFPLFKVKLFCLVSLNGQSQISGGSSTSHPTQLELQDILNWVLNSEWVACDDSAAKWKLRRAAAARSSQCRRHHAHPEVILSHCHIFHLLDKMRTCRHTPTYSQGRSHSSRQEGRTWSRHTNTAGLE